jgi:precorrin-2 C(20)-methyltransferase
MAGKFYGVSLGPAVRDLIVPRAIKRLEESDVIYLMTRENTRTHKLVMELIGERNISFYFPDNLRWGEWGLDPVHEKTAAEIARHVSEGRTVSLIVFGDVSLYSPHGYLLPYLKQHGVEIETVPGVAYFALTGEASMIRDDESLLLAGCKNIPDLERALDVANTICIFAVDKPTIDTVRAYAREKGLVVAKQIKIGAEGEADEFLDMMAEDFVPNGGIVVIKRDPALSPKVKAA